MIKEWGMGKKKVYVRYDEAVAHEIEDIIERAYETALSTLNAHLVDLGKVSQLLLKEDTISGKDVKDIIGEPR